MEIHEYTWLVVLAFIISFIDAFSIGANDVANAFATSVASRSLTLKQACAIACVSEFLGAVLLGAGVAETIRSGIANISFFKNDPELLMLGMFCANLASSVWTLVATKFSMPVSTTHSVVGGVIGMAVAAYGFESVSWEWGGFGQIVASWFISPVLAGTIAASVFLTVKYSVMVDFSGNNRSNSFKRATLAIPIYTFFAVSIIFWFCAYKGAPALKLSAQPIGYVCAIAFGGGAVVALMVHFIAVPRIVAYIERTPEISEDMGLTDKVVDVEAVATKSRADEENEPLKAEETDKGPEEIDKDLEAASPEVTAASPGAAPQVAAAGPDSASDSALSSEIGKDSKLKKFGGFLTKGVNQDVHSEHDPKVQQMKSNTKKFDAKAERMFSWLQVMTATCNSFAHGANDLANALAPMATVYYIWEHAAVSEEKKFSAPLWQIAYCAAALNVGLAIYGYKIMASLGANITHHTPSRGFNMELGAMLTVLVASVAGIPVSTTHCITGATVGVGLTQGEASNVNWKHVGKICFGWIITVPAAALISGLSFALMAYSPRMPQAVTGV